MGRSHRRSRWWLELGALIVCGCGPQVEAPTDCDGPGPTLLLELERGPSYATIQKGVRDERGWLFFDGEDYEGRNVAVECGEPPRVFAHDMHELFRIDARGPWFGIRDNDPLSGWELFVLDPWGGRAPRPISRRMLGVVDDVLLIGNDTSSRRVSLWHASLGDAFELEPVTLDLPTTESQRESWARIFALDTDPVESIFVELSGDDEYFTAVVDPRTGETRFVEALHFTGTKLGGRFVVLSELEGDERVRYVVVDTLDPTRRLDIPAEGRTCCGAEAEVISLVRDPDGAAQTHLVLLPELLELQLEGAWSGRPPGFAISGTTGDDRKLVRGPDGFYVIEPDAAAPVLLHTGYGPAKVIDDALWIFHRDVEDSFEVSPSDLSIVAVPLDGSPPVTVVHPPVVSPIPLSGGRWALQHTFAPGEPSAIRVFDPSTGREEIVVDDADPGLLMWNRSGVMSELWLPSLRPRAPDDTILFTRSTDDRTAVWRVVL